MAYDADPTKKKDEDGATAESQYASLLPGGAEPASPAAVGGGVAAPAAAPKSGVSPGFVNQDRYASANKSTTDRLAADVSRRGAGLENEFKSVQAGVDKDIAAGRGSAIPAASGVTGLAATTTAATQNQLLGSGQQATVDDAKKYAAQTYTGPDAEAVASRYAPLLSQADDLRSKANATKQGDFSSMVKGANAFDNALLSNAGAGRLIQDSASKVGSLYGQAPAASAAAANTAKTDVAAQASAWAPLLEKYNTDTAAALTAESDANGKKLTDRKLWGESLDRVSASITDAAGPEKAGLIRDSLLNATTEELDELNALNDTGRGPGSGPFSSAFWAALDRIRIAHGGMSLQDEEGRRVTGNPGPK